MEGSALMGIIIILISKQKKNTEEIQVGLTEYFSFNAKRSVAKMKIYVKIVFSIRELSDCEAQKMLKHTVTFTVVITNKCHQTIKKYAPVYFSITSLVPILPITYI